MSQYFIYNDGKKLGPFSLRDLRDQNLTSETHIWKSGMNNWEKAPFFDELAGSFTVVSKLEPLLKEVNQGKAITPAATAEGETNADKMLMLFIGVIALQSLYYLILNWVVVRWMDVEVYSTPWVWGISNILFDIVPIVLAILVKNSKFRLGMILVSIIPIIISILNIILY